MTSMQSARIPVPSGHVAATHHHVQFGACVIVNRIGDNVLIRNTTGGTSLVPAKTIHPLPR